MDNDTIEIKTGNCTDTAQVLITEVRPSGWMAWYKSPLSNSYNQAMIPIDLNCSRDPFRCPYPLFQTRESAIDAAKRSLNNGGEVVVVRITL